MRIIVSHDGRQHVNHLLRALVQKHWLARFYAGFAANIHGPLFQWWPRLHRQLRKRSFAGVPVGLIRSFGLSLLLSKVLNGEYRTIRVAYYLFDRWVANSLRYEKFDVLIGYENSNFHSFEMAKRLGKVTVLDLAHIHHEQSRLIREQYTPEKINRSEIAYINQRKQAALNLSDYVLTLSSFATKSLAQYGVAPDRIYELNLGVDTTFFYPVQRPGGPFRILYVGAVRHAKGIGVLLKAYERLGLSNTELTVVGPVGDGKDLLAQCTRTIRHVPFLHHDELVAYYQQADVFVFPSYLDSWGQVVLEAMACGTPVIVTENTGAKDAVAQGGGFVIPAGDELALSEKISYFYRNRGAVEQMGHEARRVAEQYTWANYHRQITDALTDIARRKGINTQA